MSVFEEACYLSNQRWTSSLPLEFEEIKFSKQHEKRMRILFDKMRRDKYHRFTKKATIALIAAILIVSMTITAFAVPASRDFIIHKFFDHSTYTVVNGEHNEVGDITVGYIPEGFEKTYENKGNYEIIQTYQKSNSEEWFEIKETSFSHTADFDTELIIQKEVVRNGKKYVCYVSKNTYGVIWNNGDFVFVITGNLPKEMLLEIATSI